jgi:hypothetical protein
MLIGTDIGLLNDTSPSQNGRLPDLYHLLYQRVTDAPFAPAGAIDARMKNKLPSGAYLPFALIVILRRLNDILHFLLFHRRCALKILSSSPFAPDVCSTLRGGYTAK